MKINIRNFIKENWFRLSIIILLLIIGFFVSSSSDIKKLIYFAPKTITVSDSYVFIQGTWLPSNNKETNFFGEKDVNTSSIYCDKQTQKCDETRGVLVFSKSLDAYGFYTHNFEYEIKEWGNNYLKAEMIGAGTVFNLNINFQNKTAILNITENQNNPTASTYTDTAILGN